LTVNGADGIHGKRIPRAGASTPIEPNDNAVDPKSRTVALNSDAPLAPGLEHKIVAPGQEARTTHLADVRDEAKYLKAKTGKEPVNVESYGALTGIHVDEAEAARLDQKVKQVARSLGMDHHVGFAIETDYMGFFKYPFLGTFRGDLKPEQPILVGIGLKAKEPEDIDLLYKYFNRGPIPRALLPWLRDFLSLDETQRIEAVLVHEKHELDAVGWAQHPHHISVQQSAKTEYRVQPRVRKNLELYARLNKEVFGEPR
jgi:hypothetical protein